MARTEAIILSMTPLERENPQVLNASRKAMRSGWKGSIMSSFSPVPANLMGLPVGSDMVFLDTAGRLHVDENLMDELKRMKAAVHPNEIL